MPLRCLIVDDSRTFLAAARSLLELEGVTVLATSTTAADAQDHAAELQPDVVLVDVMLGGESGVQLAQDLHAAGHEVLMISTHSKMDIQDLLSESPALGFVAKSELSADAIRRALDRP